MKETFYDETFYLLRCFTHEWLIVLILLIGLFGKEITLKFNKRYFLEALLILTISVLYNFSLKYTFKVPLSQKFGLNNYAFPSGHMSSAIAFYGWLAIRYHSNLLNLFVGFLLLGIASELIYFGYHVVIDVIGSFFFCSLLLYGYHLFLSRYYNYLIQVNFALTSCLMIYLYITHNHDISYHKWLIYIVSNITTIIIKKYYKNKIKID